MPNSKTNRFVARITGARRQVTVPEELLAHFSVRPGEAYFSWTISGDHISSTELLGLIPIRKVQSEVREDVTESLERINAGDFDLSSPLVEALGDRQTFVAQITAPRRQMTLPRAFLERLGAKVGDFMAWEVQGRKIVITEFLRLVPVTTIHSETREDISQSKGHLSANEYRALSANQPIEEVADGPTKEKTG